MILSLIPVLVFLSSNIFIFQLNIVEILAAPVIDKVDAMHFLAKYGYTKTAEDKVRTGYRFMKHEMIEALKEYQKFYKLEVTGKLDKQTMNLMQQPRCGVPDKFPDHLKRYKFLGGRWDKEGVTYQIMNNLEGKSYQVPFTAVESDFSRALNLWQPYIPIQLQLSDNPGFYAPDVPVYFTSQGFDGPAGVLATAYPPPSDPPYYIASMQFDMAEDWYFENMRYGPEWSQGLSFYQVATHELGHSLGLDHSNDINAIMYPYHRPQLSDNDLELGSDDIQGIQAIYYYNR